jgi:RNA polymerase sigma-70 factor (ECF subfamily)
MINDSPGQQGGQLRLANRDAPEALLAHLDSRYRRALLAYFGRRVRSPAEAEDLTQDVFERMLRSLEHGPILNAEAFIFRIAVNLLRDRARTVRSHGVEEPLPSEAVADFAEALTEGLSPERVVLGERSLQEALSALDELGERTRAMFYLYRFENLKVREIAELYGITVSGVEKQISRALLHLTRRMQSK